VALQLVFSQNLDPSGINLSSRFTGAIAFLIEAPLISSELEIDVFLQIYIDGVVGKIVRNIPLAKISEQAILLNLTDTEIIQTIPAEFVNTGYEMALLFVPNSGETTFLYASVIQPDCSLCELDNRLNELSAKLDLITSASNMMSPSAFASASNNDFIQLSILGLI